MAQRQASIAGLSLLLVLMLQIPSLRAIMRYAPYPEIAAPVICLAAFGLYMLVLRAFQSRWIIARPIAWPITALVVIALIAAAIFYIYPIADARSAIGAGSTSDDALIAPIEALKMGRGLYDLDGLLEVKASPGPAWVLANAPFTFMGHAALPYSLLTPFWLALGWIVLRATGNGPGVSGLWLILPFTSLIAWELSVSGYDIIALSCAITLLYALTERNAGSWKWIWVIAILVGLFGTARIIFPFLAPLFGLVVWKRNRVQGVVFTLIALAVTAAVHAVFYVQSADYHPFYLIGRAENQMGQALMIAGAIVTAIVCLIAFLRMKPTPVSSLGWVLLCLATPLVFVATGELLAVNFQLTLWEGGNYLIPAAGLAALFAARLTAPPEDALTKSSRPEESIIPEIRTPKPGSVGGRIVRN
jgi:hypothetical protein